MIHFTNLIIYWSEKRTNFIQFYLCHNPLKILALIYSKIKSQDRCLCKAGMCNKTKTIKYSWHGFGSALSTFYVLFYDAKLLYFDSNFLSVYQYGAVVALEYINFIFRLTVVQLSI